MTTYVLPKNQNFLVKNKFKRSVIAKYPEIIGYNNRFKRKKHQQNSRQNDFLTHYIKSCNYKFATKQNAKKAV